MERLDNGQVLPMLVGMLEADSCFCSASTAKVVVTDLRKGFYYAVIHLLDKGGMEPEIDSRPSDAIALALRFDCPIFVEEPIFIKCAQQRGEEEQNRGTSLEDMEPSGSA